MNIVKRQFSNETLDIIGWVHFNKKHKPEVHEVPYTFMKFRDIDTSDIPASTYQIAAVKDGENIYGVYVYFTEEVIMDAYKKLKRYKSQSIYVSVLDLTGLNLRPNQRYKSPAPSYDNDDADYSSDESDDDYNEFMGFDRGDDSNHIDGC